MKDELQYYATITDKKTYPAGFTKSQMLISFEKKLQELQAH